METQTESQVLYLLDIGKVVGYEEDLSGMQSPMANAYRVRTRSSLQ